MINQISRPLDVHKWSEHKEVNKFVNFIYENYFRLQNPKLVKKHIKVILLDLYVAWKEDPLMKLGVNMNNNAYKAKSRYNELHISKKTILVVNHLHNLKFIHLKLGYFAQGEKEGRISRIWAADKLIKHFEKAKYGLENFQTHSDREAIVLRDNSKKDIEYEDTTQTIKMRELVKAYNVLLKRTFIDIPELKEPCIIVKNKHIYISQHEKFVRRIFSNSSWNENGRFYGGWWQRIPKQWRSKIYINDMPTIEDDYSSLHPILLYAQKGIDYNKLKKGDPYNVPKLDINDQETKRKIIKTLLLTAINAKDERSCFQAVKSELQIEIPDFKFSFENLNLILQQLKNNHSEIADDFCNGKGIGLLNLDSQIAEYVIEKFVSSDIPILCIHDSFIVSVKQDNFLRKTMVEAVQNIINNANPKIKRVGFGYTDIHSNRHLDRDFYLDRMIEISAKSPNTTEEYMYRKQLFNENSKS